MKLASLTSIVVAIAVGAAPVASAQTPPPPPPPSGAQPAAGSGATFKQEELDAMLAPIALYPDALLSQVLMATTYPLEIVEAARWQKQNASLKGTALQDALQKQPWDESVKSLTAFPEVLDRLNKDVGWTQKLGDAFLGQQQQVMDTIQSLRAKAQSAGNLKSNEQQKVETQTDAGKTYIVIQPTNPEVVYVPTYQPTVVYGAWPYPAYPPYYPPYWAPGAAFVNGFFWGVGIAAGAALWGGCNWGRGEVNVNVNRYNNFNRTNISNGNWNHNVNHRSGVPYRDNGARGKYGQGDRQAAQARDQFRGRQDSLGGQGLSDRAGLQDAQRRGAGQGGFDSRGGAGQGSFDRGGAQNRAGGGQSNFASQNRAGQGGSRSDLGASTPGSAQRNYSGANRGSGGGGNAFSGGNGAQTRAASSRGNASMGARGGGGAPRGGGGGRGGGGRR
ncbi:MAG TPA: DUF3300 domain-containing protein [Vicinamibacterales bacterium]|nr:DUF3300 domain-containing protein [Vicinamibacterales bacterium]